MDDETEIRELIHRWATAVHAGDLAGVTADHTEDVVMFDVPPPHRGVRGAAEYREVWPGFFEWQASGACFEIDELDVTASGDVAWAQALLRCGTPDELAAAPDVRLRLSLGLRREGGRWAIAHEHHSFADLTEPAATADAVRDVHRAWTRATQAKDLDAIMEHIAPDVVSYEQEGALEVRGAPAVREVCAQGLDAVEHVTMETPDLEVRVDGRTAVSWGLDRVRGTGPDGEPFETWSRGTRVFAWRDGRWLLVHQHVSVPA
ncbi:YybH family protein [Actinomycetospora termitidis]|uniref:SgcJ/EcaC family oxidoreductase n=1 Tax=Actinomycetospora termitidis TaxID=3053470 RepID=A0ABT7M7X3_9PSEU|nr:SgcJ/EcaC family oxidoreductase [Actinomycetospora sp. Odt1-22]MDL5155533.1 SgcJ/EcaC family oxidoreductase [Actinomycetospora sp. Odt1-22]